VSAPILPVPSSSLRDRTQAGSATTAPSSEPGQPLTSAVLSPIPRRGRGRAGGQPGRA
jgi:hypothetical protein